MVFNSSCVCPGETYTAIIGAWASVGDAAQAEVEQGRICNGGADRSEIASWIHCTKKWDVQFRYNIGYEPG